MLISADSFEKLDFSALMELYLKENAENGVYLLSADGEIYDHEVTMEVIVQRRTL